MHYHLIDQLCLLKVELNKKCAKSSLAKFSNDVTFMKRVIARGVEVPQ